MPLRTLDDLGDLAGRRVFVRLDLNVPLEDGVVTDDARIRASLPTLTELLERGASIVAASHLGRPNGRVVETLRLGPVAELLRSSLDRVVEYVPTDGVLSPEVEQSCQALAFEPGRIVLLENLRFDPGEEANDRAFAQRLAGLADLYVDDAFGAVHRAHASVVALPEVHQEQGRDTVAGRLLQQEVEALSRLVGDPARPYVAVLGGAKVSDKLGTIGALVERVDALLIGGAMAFTFIAADGGSVGDSLVEPERFDEVRAARARADERGVVLQLPEDVVAAPSKSLDAPRHTVPSARGARGRARSRHRSAGGGGVREDDRRRQDDRVERTDGGVRARAVQRRDPRGRHGDRRRERLLGGRRRRQPRGREEVRAGERVRPPLDRRGRLARVPRGPRAARHRGPGGGSVSGRKPLIAANWKMHKTHLEAIQAVQKLSYLLDKDDAERVEVVICPAATSLRSVQTLIDSDRLPYGLGAQDVHWEDEGAFTGEISPPMLVALKVGYVIVGHSERRAMFGETDETVNRKVRAVFAHGMTPILCVGETLKERDVGATEDRVTAQVRADLAGVPASDAAKLVVAYEPIWAIGTGRNAEPSDAGQVIGLIRQTLAELYDGELAQAVRVQYGGSVKAGNIRDFMAHPEIDGALVGGASLDPEELALIVKYR